MVEKLDHEKAALWVTQKGLKKESHLDPHWDVLLGGWWDRGSGDCLESLWAIQSVLMMVYTSAIRLAAERE